jgi:hypothetical protein
VSRRPSRARVEQEREETEGLSRELMGGARRGSRGQCLCRAHGRVCIFRMCKYVCVPAMCLCLGLHVRGVGRAGCVNTPGYSIHTWTRWGGEL